MFHKSKSKYTEREFVKARDVLGTVFNLTDFEMYKDKEGKNRGILIVSELPDGKIDCSANMISALQNLTDDEINEIKTSGAQIVIAEGKSKEGKKYYYIDDAIVDGE